ncbi:MAG: O-antigen ligase family protein, partial [Thermoleophilaceae bacterium]|nr:O-antigen ligase family protein [Thermoleophilaceae bacterium]
TTATASLRPERTTDFFFVGLAIGGGLLVAVSPKLGVAAVLAACVGAIMLRRPSVFVALLIVSVFFGAVKVGGLTMARIVGPIAFLVTGAVVLNRRSFGLGGSSIHRWIAAYGLLAVASIFWSLSATDTYGLLVSLILAVTYMLAITTLIQTRDDLELALLTFPFAAISLALLGMVALSIYKTPIAAEPLIGDRNFFAAFLVVALPPSFLLLVRAHSFWLRAAAVTAIVLIVVAVLGSGSQGGMLSMLGIGIAACLIVPRPETRRKLLPVFVVLLPIALVAMVVILSAGGAETSGTSGAKSAIKKSSVDRVNLWLGATTAVREHPVTGIGYGAYAPNAAAFMLETEGVDLQNYNLPQHPQEAHNSYLEALAELGPLGLFLFLGMIGSTVFALSRALRNAHRNDDRQMAAISQTLLLSLIGFAIASVFLSVATNRGWWVLFALAIVVARIDQASLPAATNGSKPALATT